MITGAPYLLTRTLYLFFGALKIIIGAFHLSTESLYLFLGVFMITSGARHLLTGALNLSSGGLYLLTGALYLFSGHVSGGLPLLYWALQIIAQAYGSAEGPSEVFKNSLWIS